MIRVMALDEQFERIPQMDSLEVLKMDACSWCWIDFSEPSTDEIGLLESYFHFHHLAVEDCRHSLQRPKMDHYDNTHFLVLHSVGNAGLSKRE